MKIELMKQERMGVEGKGILRSLQNDSLPLIDLLIREALQNSLDATKKDAKRTHVDISVCEFRVEILAEHLEGITDLLKKRYRNRTQKAICISDKNTIGLIGDVRKKEGNIYNLIYTIQKNQEQQGAGGSWGLGKTSYFRVGNGIVLYYSRVKLSNGKYEERLAGSLIEDSTKENRLLDEDDDRGIAWWGVKDDNKRDKYDPTYPLTDSNKIHMILDIFNMKPYVDKDTGTAIIIPFIDEDKVLPKHEDENRKLYWWEKDIESAIEIAIQKWYSPRIFNLKYKGSYLVPSINGEVLNPEDFQPFFKKIHDIYIQGLRRKSTKDITVDKINLKRRGISSHDGLVGWLAHGLYSEEDLKMTPPNNEVHPLEYFGKLNRNDLENKNAKMVAYARKPGMILEYDINGEWSNKVSPQENKFLLSFFIPNSKGKLYEKFIEPNVNTLEDYLRKTEKSDHAEWEDVTLNNTNITIVDRIKRNVSKALENKYNEPDENLHKSKASVLGRKIGDMLLPKHGVGGRSGIKPIVPGGGSNQGSRKKSKVSIDVLSFNVNQNNELEVLFNLSLEKNLTGDISVNIKTGPKNYNEEGWKKDMGKEAIYPFSIKKVSIDKIGDLKISPNAQENNKDLSIYLTSLGNDSFFIAKNRSDRKLEIEGSLLIEVKDVLMQPLLVVNEVKDNG